MSSQQMERLRALDMGRLSRPHFVYRLYDKDDELLYIGCTSNVGNRVRMHRKYSPRSAIFAHWIARIESVEYPNYQTALSAERVAIQSELPPFNVRWNPKGGHK